MKQPNMALFLAVLTMAPGFLTTRAQSADLYKVNVSAICISTNDNGQLRSKPFTARDIIRDCADGQGITNLTGLTLVYNRDVDTVQVVNRTNGAVVCDFMAFDNGVAVANAAGTVRERVAFAYLQDQHNADGTIRGTERYVFDEHGAVIAFHFNGKLHIGTPATDSSRAKVYSGTFTTAAKFRPLLP